MSRSESVWAMLIVKELFVVSLQFRFPNFSFTGLSPSPSPSPLSSPPSSLPVCVCECVCVFVCVCEFVCECVYVFLLLLI